MASLKEKTPPLRAGFRLYRGRILPGIADVLGPIADTLCPVQHCPQNKSDNKPSPIVDPQVLHFMQVPLAARKSQAGLETSIRTARRVERRTSLIDRFWRRTFGKSRRQLSAITGSLSIYRSLRRRILRR
jgi:hypothetical protein